MLRLERVSKFYSGNGLVSTGFSKVDLEFDIGEFVAITGESGSGKSTLLNVISGLDSYEEGEMYIMGQPTSGFSKEDLEEYRKKYIGSIFQTFNLINSYTVYQNVELVLLMSGYDKSEIPGRVREIIEQVGLSDYEKTKASKLSGGQKQRVAIARALAKETPIIVADEPTGNLDSQSAAEIIKLLHQLSKDKLIIVVTHNYDQVEPYVTRKIAMHDGRVAEDKRLRVTAIQADQKETEIKTAKADSLSFGSMVRLGVRNTFNIPAKFLLLLVVFIFLCSAVFAQYSSFMYMGEMTTGGYNNYFSDTDKDRILVTQPGGGEFTDADYAKIKQIDNVDKIVEYDLLLDLVTNVTDDSEKGEYYVTTKLGEAADYADQLEEGRMPKNSNEAIMICPRDQYAAQYMDVIMDKKAEVMDQNSGNAIIKDKIKIVGYGYMTEEQQKAMEESDIYLEGYLCVNDDTMANIRLAALERYCTQEIELANHIAEGNSAAGVMPIRASSKVPKGEIYVPEDVDAMAESGAVGKELKLTNKSLYFEDTFQFKVGAVYNKSNLSYYLDRDDFDAISGTLFINPEDYGKMFNKGNFQSSVIVSDYKTAEETAVKIQKAGFDTFHVNDGLISYSQGFDIIQETLRTIMLVAMLLVLFFITYFITKLILKSRNVYFSTIRMLGATKANCSSLLKTELFAVFNIAFFFCIGVIGIIKVGNFQGKSLLQNTSMNEMLSFLTTGDYVILYVVLCLMAILLAARYARQLFKKTAMNAYKEEV